MSKPFYGPEELELLSKRINHDLYRDIGNISGLVKLVKMNYQEELDENFQEYLSHIEKSCSGLKDSLLFLNKVYEIQKPFPREAVSLNHIFEELIENRLSPLIEKKSANVSRDNDLGIIFSKKSHMRELLGNILENSLIYNTSEPPIINFSARVEADQFRLTIKDNGVGLPDGFKLSGNFYCKTNYELNKKAKGMGLAICKKIISYYGGELSAENIFKDGTVIACLFPKNLLESP